MNIRSITSSKPSENVFVVVFCGQSLTPQSASLKKIWLNDWTPVPDKLSWENEMELDQNQMWRI